MSAKTDRFERIEKLTEEGELVTEVAKNVFQGNADETFRALGRYFDKHKMKVSREVIVEFENANRICEQPSGHS